MEKALSKNVLNVQINPIESLCSLTWVYLLSHFLFPFIVFIFSAEELKRMDGERQFVYRIKKAFPPYSQVSQIE